MKHGFLFVPLIIVLGGSVVGGESLPRGAITDNRVKTLVYNPNQVYKLVAYYGYQIDLQLADNEDIRTIAAGDSVGWQIVGAGKHIFIKPMADKATTNLSIITTKRAYIFDLNSRAPASHDDITYLVRFKYPDTEWTTTVSNGSDKSPSDYNFDYKITGSRRIQPERVFDDGEFTYFQFNSSRELPAIFVVGSDGKESLVNFRMEGHSMVVERLGDFYTVRNGKETATVINERKLGRDPA